VIFVDSSFWIAIRNERDQYHRRATEWLGDPEGGPLVTTNQVRGETWTFLRRRVGHASASQFLAALERSRRTRVVFVSEEMEAVAFRWLRKHDERSYSFVDATSFVIMRTMRIRDALTYDDDFVAAGFRRVS
jgi:predicted nucleic acid-binding protein